MPLGQIFFPVVNIPWRCVYSVVPVNLSQMWLYSLIKSAPQEKNAPGPIFFPVVNMPWRCVYSVVSVTMTQIWLYSPIWCAPQEQNSPQTNLFPNSKHPLKVYLLSSICQLESNVTIPSFGVPCKKEMPPGPIFFPIINIPWRCVYSVVSVNMSQMWLYSLIWSAPQEKNAPRTNFFPSSKHLLKVCLLSSTCQVESNVTLFPHLECPARKKCPPDQFFSQ